MISTESHTGIFIPDGYNQDGTNRPLIEIEIVEKRSFPDGETLIAYVRLDDPKGPVRNCFENALIRR